MVDEFPESDDSCMFAEHILVDHHFEQCWEVFDFYSLFAAFNDEVFQSRVDHKLVFELVFN